MSATVVGYRAFTFDLHMGGVLISPIRAHIWTPGVNEASCKLREALNSWEIHPVPSTHLRGAGCGFNAWWDVRECTSIDPDRRFTYITAVVLGSGSTLVYEKGWRSQYCRVIAVINDFHIAALETRYNVPTLPPDDLGLISAFGSEFGMTQNEALQWDMHDEA